MSNNKLEQEFKELADEHLSAIQEKVRESRKLLDEAINLSEKHGIPFHSEISALSQDYVPVSFRKKFPDISTEFVTNICETWDLDEYSYGWEHSAVC